MIGACLCIPSTEERQEDLSSTLKKYKITLADFTPSIARNITGLESLSTLVLGGEVVLPSDRELAGQTTQVRSAYGPAECTPTATILDLSKSNEDSIGRGAGLCTWIVDPDNINHLAPVGSPGELLLEGPLVSDGYWDDYEKTVQAFVEDPEWLIQGVQGRQPGRCGRLYRTGDLVQYIETGTLKFIGRKDTLVKLRGQRVELEEVEYCVKKALQTQDEKLANVKIVVELIHPRDTENKLLAAFVSCGGSQDEHNVAVERATAGINEHLVAMLPLYMVPSIFIPLESIPRTSTDKIDRRKLRAIGSELGAKEVIELGRVNGERRAPRTDAERLIQRLWVEVVQADPESIGIDDSFFRIGGDSIGAIKLVRLARENGLTSLTVKDIFRNPVLRDLASLST